MKTILTELEAARFLKISQTTLARLRYRQEVPYVPGKPVRYIQESLIAWIHAKEVQPLPAKPKMPPTPRSQHLDAVEMMRALSAL